MPAVRRASLDRGGDTKKMSLHRRSRMSPGVGPAARRRRRLRRILIATPFVVVLVWAVVSYSTYMMVPTSMTMGERSAEWVRDDVPFGNQMVDTGEHIYYTGNATKTDGPHMTTRPSVGVSPTSSSRP